MPNDYQNELEEELYSEEGSDEEEEDLYFRDIGSFFDDEESFEDSESSDALSSHINDDLVHTLGPCWFKVGGTLTVGTNKDLSWIAPQHINITEIYAYVRTAPTGAALTIDIN